MPIKTIVTDSTHLNIQTSSTPYIGNGSMAQAVGMVRYNTNSQALEVYDGYNWTNIQAHTVVSMQPDSDKALTWAKEQMQRMSKLEKLAETNPTIADALAALRHAEEQLRLVEILCEEEQNV